MRRRTYVAMLGSASLAGCVGRPGNTDEAETDEEEPDEAETDEAETDAVATDEEPTYDTEDLEFQKLWAADLPDDEGRISLEDYQATADGETAYLGTESELTALSLADGTEQWTLSLDTPLDGVTVDDDGLYTLQEKTVQAVDPDTGESRWSTTADKLLYTSYVTTGDDHVAAGGGNRTVVVFEKESGQQTGRLPAAPNSQARGWNGGFVVADSNEVAAYDPDGTAQWTADASASWLTPVAGSMVVGGGRGSFVGVDLESGTRAWTTGVDGELENPMTAGTDDTVFVYPGPFDGETFYALDADTGAVRWEQSVDSDLAFPPVALESGVVIHDGSRGRAYEHTTGTVIDSTHEGGYQYGATGSGRTAVIYDSRAAAVRL
ncbi:PQQ-binding-like beta-propeller repeat protein [Haloarcula salinisoli]|uniref:PQQ-like beta-propeller repeat protein n=1 Tax=Haloarcula salinisoli TaxID=2487746 RepID=A0A8J7YDF0_9EURY|nr:PQQ-binding-like beta-propeller repeat protein [Halomicroarcula salinisoli]MBX0303875.1 PQQ-like beta-propeller repeat protein [Halomicroarcula salinisoli]